MNIYGKLFWLITTLIYIATLSVTTSYVVAADAVTTNSTPATGDTVVVAPEVRKALDTVYLAAKEANTLHPLDEIQANALTEESGTGQLFKRPRTPFAQMLAVGLGVAAGIVALNLITGGTSTTGNFYSMSSAMFGGMIGDYVYRRHYAPPLPSIPKGVSERVTP